MPPLGFATLTNQARIRRGPWRAVSSGFFSVQVNERARRPRLGRRTDPPDRLRLLCAPFGTAIYAGMQWRGAEKQKGPQGPPQRPPMGAQSPALRLGAAATRRGPSAAADFGFQASCREASRLNAEIGVVFRRPLPPGHLGVQGAAESPRKGAGIGRSRVRRPSMPEGLLRSLKGKSNK